MIPSDDTLLEVHNIISSSTDIETTKLILKKYPQVLSFHVLQWAGSIVLHTACSRQPENITLINLLVEEGLNYNVGGSDARGGLLVKDNFNHTPLNFLVSKNAIQTLRQLQNHDPPNLYPRDVIECQLFSNVHSTFHADMVRFLVRLCPESVSQVFDIFDGNFLINYMCITVADCRFLLRVIPILVEEGIRQELGGEYGIGGLFVVQAGLSCIDLLIDRRRQSWDVLAPIIHNSIGDAPILHGAILAHSISISYSTHIQSICQYFENSAQIRDSKGRLPIHLAAEQGLRWKEDNMEDIVKANLPAVKEKDPLSGLPVYALAAVGEDSSLSTVYELLCLCIEDFTL